MKLKLTCTVLAVTLLAAAAVQAQPAAPSPQMQAARDAFRKACEADTQSLCGDKQGREVFQCLRENSAKLSGGCKDAMSKLRPPAAK